MAMMAVVVLTAACARVEPGQVGIKVSYLDGHGGTNDYRVASGFVWFVPVLDRVLVYPTAIQTARLEARDGVRFNSKEGTAFSADLFVSYFLPAQQVPVFYEKFRSDDLRAYLQGFLRNAIEAALADAAVGHSAVEIYAGKKQDLVKHALALVNDRVKSSGVVVEQLGFLGMPSPPDSIKSEIQATLVAQQSVARVESEARQARVEMNKQLEMADKMAKARITQAKAEAEANRLLSASLTPGLMQWEKMKNPGQTCGPKELSQHRKLPISAQPLF